MQLRTVRDAARRVAASLPFSILLLLLACVFWITMTQVYGVLVFVMIIALLLILCDDISVTLLPFLLTAMVATKCYNSFDTFMGYAPLGVVAIGALLFHFLVYRKKFSIGPSFFGILAVAVAVTVGGAFSISAEDYFSGTSLYYVAGLGIGMAATYLLLKSQYTHKPDYSLRERVFSAFFIAAFLGVVMVTHHLIANFSLVREIGIQVQWSNNISTMMMFFLPVPFYYALKKHRLYLLLGFLFYLAIVLTGSRGGLLMGGIELILCLVYVSLYDKPLRIASITVVSAGLLVMLVGIRRLIPLVSGFISKDEPRYLLMFRALEDFSANPLFGRGLGYRGNVDIYDPIKGAATWYHMLIFQIIGSLGTVGIVAYSYQFYTRVRLIFRRITPSNLVLGLSYAGVFLMSMVNPGEFCPVPYELLAVLLFVLLELPEEKDTANAFLPIRLKHKAVITEAHSPEALGK